MNNPRAIVVVVLAAFTLVVLFSVLYTVHQTQQALVFQFGQIKSAVREPGLHMKMPFIQNVRLIDKRILEVDFPPTEYIAADQKRLVVDAFARFQIVDPVKYFQSTQTEDAEGGRRLLRPILDSEIRTILARQPFSDILSGKRAEMMVRIRDIVDAKSRGYGIEVVDVRIRRADLPDANSQAVFRRMQTEREQEAKLIRATGEERAREIRATADKNVTIVLAEARRDSEILRGYGDACRNNIYANAYEADPDFFAFYRSMQAYERALRDGKTSLVLSPDSDFFRFFDSVKGSTSTAARAPVPGVPRSGMRDGGACDRAFTAIALANVSTGNGVQIMSALGEIEGKQALSNAVTDVARRAVLVNQAEALQKAAQASADKDLGARLAAALEEAAASPVEDHTPRSGVPVIEVPDAPSALPALPGGLEMQTPPTGSASGVDGGAQGPAKQDGPGGE
jgi:membrane protease subunit HflC